MQNKVSVPTKSQDSWYVTDSQQRTLLLQCFAARQTTKQNCNGHAYYIHTHTINITNSTGRRFAYQLTNGQRENGTKCTMRWTVTAPLSWKGFPASRWRWMAGSGGSVGFNLSTGTRDVDKDEKATERTCYLNVPNVDFSLLSKQVCLWYIITMGLYSERSLVISGTERLHIHMCMFMKCKMMLFCFLHV